MSDPVHVLLANLPGSESWPISFWGRLVEEGLWYEPAFWELHDALVAIALRNKGSEAINRQIAEAVSRVQARVLGCIASHYDSNDVFTIINLDDDRLREFVGRFEHATVRVFSGEVLPEESYDLGSSRRVDT